MFNDNNWDSFFNIFNNKKNISLSDTQKRLKYVLDLINEELFSDIISVFFVVKHFYSAFGKLS